MFQIIFDSVFAEKHSVSNLFEKITSDSGDVLIDAPVAGTSINFTNSTGKHFSLTIDEIISTLRSILAKIDLFKSAGAEKYEEDRMRTLFEAHLENPVSKALAKTQTKTVYTVLGRCIHFANNEGPYVDKTLDLDGTKIQNTIDQLQMGSLELMKAAVVTPPHNQSTAERKKGGENILYYGAPGTGKSFEANAESKKDNSYVVRTLFHPDMQNSDFFGSLKPGIDNSGPTYEFRAGPFAKALRHADQNPAQRVYLIIEELNRAMAAAVFGELFQLLDRDKDGTSEYSVDSPSEEFTKWFGADKFRVPSNMWILATMNSADQGVYPLDTAFRRRWRQNYIPIEYEIAPEVDIRIATAVGREEVVTWRQFVENLNDYMTEVITIPEDRLIGPRFLKESELKDGVLPGKLLIYLWDDLLRHHGRYDLFTETIKTYGDIHKAIKAKKPIFTKAFMDTLEFKPSETQAV